VNIVAALHDHDLLGRVLPDLTSWRAWLVVLRAIFALPMNDQDRVLYH